MTKILTLCAGLVLALTLSSCGRDCCGSCDGHHHGAKKSCCGTCKTEAKTCTKCPEGKSACSKK